MAILNQLGKRVKILRELRNLTQEQLAEKSGTSSQYISALERGQKNATVEMLEKIATALGVQPVILFSFDSELDQPSKQTVKQLLDQLDGRQLQKALKIISTLLD